jgi:transposase
MLTDLEAVFRSLKSELGLRPIYHHREDRAEGHLFITVLAYQAVQALRRRLKDQGFQESWSTLRRIFAGQRRITATFRQKDGRTLHVRKTTVAEPKLQQLYEALGLSASPVGVRKMVV